MNDVLLFCVQSHRKYFAVTTNIWVLACTLTMGGLLASADSACARERDSEMRTWLKETSEYAKQVGERFDRADVLSLVAVAQAERKDFKEAVHVAELIDDDVSTARGDALWKIADVMGTRRPMGANRCGTT